MGVIPELLIDMKGPELRLSRNLKCIQLEEGSIVNEGIFDFPKIIHSYLVENQEVWMDDGKIRLVCLNNNQLNFRFIPQNLFPQSNVYFLFHFLVEAPYILHTLVLNTHHIFVV